MAKEEIIAGLENAVARGESIEKAMQSMISAGYNPQEVREASQQVNMGSIGKVRLPETSSQEQQEEQGEAEAQEEQPQQYKKLPPSQNAPTESKAPKKSNKLIIILSVLLFFIIVGIGLLMIFGDTLF